MAELDPADERRLAVAAALRDLDRRLERFANGLAHARSASAWVDGAASDSIALRQAITAYTTIDLDLEDAPGTSLVCIGVIGAPRSVLHLAAAVNDAKAALKTICAPLQDHRIRIPDGKGTRVLPLIRAILRSLQRSELNLLAAYRRIPILEEMPLRVAYTRARTRSVYRKLAGDVTSMLVNAEGPRAAADRARLAALPPGERYVALVRDHYENVRANIVYGEAKRGKRRRLQMSAELPLLFCSGRGGAVPIVSFPAARPPSDPVRRRRSRLEPRALLETLPVHRYRPEYR